MYIKKCTRKKEDRDEKKACRPKSVALRRRYEIGGNVVTLVEASGALCSVSTGYPLVTYSNPIIATPAP